MNGPTRPDLRRLRVQLQGAVQGVGFRPFVHRLACELALAGWIVNSAQGVQIEVEGPPSILEAFLLRLESDRPARARVQSREILWLDPVGLGAFEIRPSTGGDLSAWILPDIATCEHCRDEIFDPANRRYRYPFTNCTLCGPRFSIILGLPYDRPRTTMRGFPMCPDCAAEYADPANRRFHAQPIACPRCGPQIEILDARGRSAARQHAALESAAEAIRSGQIVALQGLGGFQLLVDARSDSAVVRLRQRKHRAEKPFAVMFPDIDAARRDCEVNPAESRLLASPESPIVLLRRRAAGISPASGQPASAPAQAASAPGIAPAVAPGNPELGVMVPYTPLHHLLLAELGFPVVATSGNRSDEPICLAMQEALDRLDGIADLFLVHDRPIARPVDDSVVRVLLGREMVLRRARGYAPLPITLRQAAPAVLAVGAHLKNTIAIARRNQVFVSQHLGDLDTPPAARAFAREIDNLQRLYEWKPSLVACDAHPDYRSSIHARQMGLPILEVQHHYAHILACMAENDLDPPVLGVAWDGTGLGPDGVIWGGEFLHIDRHSFQRLATFRPFRLPGGDRAIQEPRRTALGLLFAMIGTGAAALRDLATLQAFTDRELPILMAMLERPFNAPLTTSAGRLFDAVASLIGLRHTIRHEGQAAMELEFALADAPRPDAEPAYPIRILPRQTQAGSPSSDQSSLASELDPRTSTMVIDWEPMVWAILDDVRCGIPRARIAARFHHALREAIVAVAHQVGRDRVVLSGGCFQNRYLTECVVRRLTREGFRPYWHQRIPPNDGGIALGQVLAAAREAGRP